jgi:glycosyltransferase involved in cell wall biosynthesis
VRTPLRVAVDATALLGARTGVGVFTHELLSHLPDHDVAPLAYATSWRGRRDLAGLVPARVSVATLPQAARPLRALWTRFDRPPIEWWTGRVDVVHGPNYVVPPTRRAAAVVTVHDLTFDRHPEMSTRDTLQYPGLIRRALRRGAWVHTESQFVADEIIERYDVDPGRLVVVPLGLTPPPPADPARGRELAGGDRYVVAIGTVEPRKDHPLLIEAFDALATTDPELRVVVAGPDGWGAEALTARIAASPHRDRIARLGWVSDEDRSALLRGARVLAYPSRYEGFGFPPLEAMSVGTPVVTTDVGALPEVVGDAACLVPPGDADALATAIARVLDDDSARAGLIARGRERVGRFTWSACAAGMAELYHRAAENG